MLNFFKALLKTLKRTEFRRIENQFISIPRKNSSQCNGYILQKPKSAKTKSSQRRHFISMRRTEMNSYICSFQFRGVRTRSRKEAKLSLFKSTPAFKSSIRSIENSAVIA